VVLDWLAQANVITRGILAADVNSSLSSAPSYLEQPLSSQQASRVLALLSVAMLETLNLLVPAPSFGGKPAPKPLLAVKLFSACDLGAASPPAAASFAAHAVLATLFPRSQQALPPFLDGVVALHLASPTMGINLTAAANGSVILASQCVGSLAARILITAKLGDGFSTYKSYSFNATVAATCVPPFQQFRPALTFPLSFFNASATLSSAASGLTTASPTAYLYPQLQSVIPFVSAAASAFSPSSTLKVLGVADASATSPFFAQPVTGTQLPNTIAAADAALVLGAWWNVSNTVNSTSPKGDWTGYNFSIAAYPDPLTSPAALAAYQASAGIAGIAANPYYSQLNQVRWLGQKNSVYRSPKQFNLVYFWRQGGNTATVPGFWSKIATQLLAASSSQSGGSGLYAADQGLYASAALFARMHAAMWDGSASGWAAKFKYLHWRPESALRYGDNSTLTAFNTTANAKGNWPSELTPVYAAPTAPGGAFTPLFNATGLAPASSSAVVSGPATDPYGSKAQLHAAWWPELATPGHPEYPSTHAVACEAAVVTLRLFFGSDSIATITGAPSVTVVSEDTYLGLGLWPGNGGRSQLNASSPSPNTLYFVNLTGSASANGTAAGAAPYAYTPTGGLSAIAYSTLSQMSRDCADSRVFGGLHLNMSANDGISLGNQVAKFTYASYPVRSVRVLDG